MKNKGFSLIELMVALAVFVSAVAIASGLFISSIKAQRRSLAHQQLLDQTSYLMEHLSRTVRMAKKDIAGTCTGAAKSNLAFSNQCLKFLDANSQCQQFCLEGSRLKDESGYYFTSPKLQVSLFNVRLSGQSQDDDLQPSITVFLDVQGEEQTNIKIQTTISQRNLDVQR